MQSIHHRLLVVPVFFLILSLVTSQSIQVTFVARVPPGTNQVTIAGNNPVLGNWQPDEVYLSPVDSVFALTVSFPGTTAVEYKFTRGSWDSEALNPDTTIPRNYRITLTADTTLYHQIPFWKDRVPAPRFGLTGNFRFHEHFLSPQLLNERTLIVWLPPTYEDFQQVYPVLYLQDGQNVFNPKTSFSGQEWHLDETATRLIQEKLIEAIIMVAIYNTEGRNGEYNPNLKGKQYSDFLIQTVKPFIDTHYRTDPSRTVVMGSSLGGLIAFHLAWEHPETFPMAACLSPAFLMDHSAMVKQVSQYHGPRKQVKLLIFNGTEGLEGELLSAVEAMDRALIKQNFTPGKDYRFKIIPGASHNEQAWSKQAREVLLYLFGT